MKIALALCLAVVSACSGKHAPPAAEPSDLPPPWWCFGRMSATGDAPGFCYQTRPECSWNHDDYAKSSVDTLYECHDQILAACFMSLPAGGHREIKCFDSQQSCASAFGSSVFRGSAERISRCGDVVETTDISDIASGGLVLGAPSGWYCTGDSPMSMCVATPEICIKVQHDMISANISGAHICDVANAAWCFVGSDNGMTCHKTAGDCDFWRSNAADPGGPCVEVL